MSNQITKIKWLNPILKIERYWTKIESAISTGMFLLLIALMLIQVLCRFVFMISIPWSEEAIRYLFIALCYIGSAVGIQSQSHIEINVLNSMLGKLRNEKRNKWERNLNIVKYVIMLLACAFIFYLCFGFTMKIKQMDAVTPAMQMKKWLLDAAVCAGFIAMSIHSFMKLLVCFFDHDLLEEGDES